MGVTSRVLLQVSSTAQVLSWHPAYRWIPVVGGFGAFGLAFAAGTNDLPISYATSVGAGTITMLQALIIACAMEFTSTVSVGNLTVDARYMNIWKETTPDAGLFMWGFFIVIISATIWLLIASYFELPVSSDSSIQGALVGLGLVTQGVHGINWIEGDGSSVLHVGGVVSIILSWTIVPIIAGIVSGLLFGFTKISLLRSQHAERRTLRAIPLYYGITVAAIIFFIILQGAPRTDLDGLGTFKLALITSLSGVLATVLAYTVVVPLAQKRLGCFQDASQGGSDNNSKDYLHDNKRSDNQNEPVSLRDTEVLTAEELLRQFAELRILETVYEGDEEMGDQSPQITIRCSPARAPSTPARSMPPVSFGQLLAGTPNRLFSYKRLRRPPQKLTRKQRFVKAIRQLRAWTIERKLEYDRETLIRHALAEKYDKKAEELFSFLQILTAMATAFVQGSIIVTGCMAPFAALKELYSHKQAFDAISTSQDDPENTLVAMEEWVLVLGASGFALGAALWGWKVSQSLGGKLVFLSPSRGFCAQLSAIVAIIIATKTQLPFSITHTLVGAILGVGIADSTKNVNWLLLIIFICAWGLTLLASCGLSAALYGFTIFSPSYSVN